MTLKRALLLIALYIILITARPYSTSLSTGIAWEWGGVEFIGEPGVFVCYSDWTPWGVDC